MTRTFAAFALCLSLAAPFAPVDIGAAPWGSQARAADPAAEIQLQRTLDAPFDLTLDKVELSKAFEEIAGRAKIALQVDPACYEALPYGATTKVSADFRQSKLHDAIEEVLSQLGLEQVVSGSSLIIRPTAPLARIGRRATWNELKLLNQLRAPNLKIEAISDTDLLAAIRNALGNTKLTMTDATPEGPARDKALDQVRKQLPTTAWRALDTYAAATGQVWFPDEQTLYIMPMRKWLERQLDRPIQMSFTNAPLEKVVAELAHLSGIRFVPEPGLYTAIPSVTVSSNNGTVRQTLDALSGATGLSYDIRDESIYLRLSKNQPATAPRGPDPIVGQIVVPLSGPEKGSFTMFVRESDLPQDVLDLRKKKLQEAIDALQKSIGGVPATTAAPPASTAAAPGPEKPPEKTPGDNPEK